MNKVALHLAMAVVVGGCTSDTTPPVQTYALAIFWTPEDFGRPVEGDLGSPQFRNTVAIAVNGRGADMIADEMIPYFVEHAVVFSNSDGARVAGEMRDGFFDLDGVQRATPIERAYAFASFVSAEPLADGWYVAALDLREWVTDHPEVFAPGAPPVSPYYEDGFVYVRFQVGPEPVWTSSYLSVGDLGVELGRGTLVTPILSAPNEGEWTTNPFRLFIDGSEAIACSELQDPDSLWWGWHCSEIDRDAEVVLRLEQDSPLAAPDGTVEQTLPVSGFEPGPNSRLNVSPRFGVDLVRGAL